jgi:C-terminal peptidase prc
MCLLRNHIQIVLFCILLLSSGLTACGMLSPVGLENPSEPLSPPERKWTMIATLATVPPHTTAIPTLPASAQATITATSTPSATTRPLSRRDNRAPGRQPTTATPTATATPVPTALSASSRQQIFEKVWRIIDENYLYADFHGLDWDAIWVEFAPRVEEAATTDEFYALMTEMVNRLGDHHSRFLAPPDAVKESQLSVGHEQRVGIGIITEATSDGAIIQHVFSGSPAAQAGLRPRDRIIAVDGAPLAVGRNIHGREGTQVRLTVVRPDDEMQDIILTRRPVEGRIAPETRRFAGDIGYIHIPTLWVNDMADQVSGALTDLVVEHSLNGLVLDVRGNPGGWRDVLTSVLGHFVQGDTGSFFDRQKATPLIIRESSGPDLRDLPLVVLIDEQTSSYAEVLAAVLQVEAGAYVIGSASAGNTETIYAYELPGGARLWVAQEGFRLSNGNNLEGQGVQPDLSLDIDWTRYSQEDDPHILEALHYLRDQ